MSLCHVAMVAKFLDENKPKTSLKREFALFQTTSIFFYLSNVGEIFLGLNPKGPYLSLEKDNENSMLCSSTLLNGRVKLGSGGFMS